MTRKPRLVLHIGMHKTGSTSLQRFFVRNRWLLRIMGVDYPHSNGPDGKRLPKHNDFFLAISHEKDHQGSPHPVLGASAGRIRDLEGKLRPGKVTVISAEGLSGQNKAFAKAFAPLAKVADVRVVCFLRRQDDWINSFYKQMVLSREVREKRTFEEFVTMPRTRRQLDYSMMLGWWADAFGTENIRVLIYPPRKSILADFLSAAGLPSMMRYLPYGNCMQNTARPSTYIERVRLANIDNLPLPAPDPSDSDSPIISKASRQALMASCAEGNEWIRRTFRPDLKSLFD